MASLQSDGSTVAVDVCDVCMSCLTGSATSFHDPRIDTISPMWHHTSASSLLHSVEYGCRICGPFWNSVSTEQQQQLFELKKIRRKDGSPFTTFLCEHVWRTNYFISWPQGTHWINLICPPALEEAEGVTDAQREILNSLKNFRMYLVPYPGQSTLFSVLFSPAVRTLG